MRMQNMTDLTLGSDKNLKVTMTSYKPNVQCEPKVGPPSQSCDDILGTMSASKQRLAFGPPGVTGIDVELPKKFVSGTICSFVRPFNFQTNTRWRS